MCIAFNVHLFKVFAVLPLVEQSPVQPTASRTSHVFKIMLKDGRTIFSLIHGQTEGFCALFISVSFLLNERGKKQNTFYRI